MQVSVEESGRRGYLRGVTIVTAPVQCAQQQITASPASGSG